MAEETVKFVPFASFVDPAFWADLTDRKLRHWGLDDSAKLCVAGFVNHDPPGVPCRLSLDYQAFNNDVQTTGGTRKVIGHLLLTNTVEEFRNIDRKALMHKFGDEIWSEIVQRRWMREPSVLNRFLLTVFANLKKFHYYYWLCAPALCFPANIRLLKPSKPFDDKELAQKCVKFSQDNRTAAYAFLIVRQASKEAELKPLTSLADPSVNIDEVTLVFADPSTQEAFPGWPLRNLLAALAYEKPQWNHVNVVCLRQRFVDGQLDTSHSVVLDIGWDGMKELKADCPTVVGWEKNAQGKLEPSFVDMSGSMDPTRIVENAVDLNLQLMRWRLVPELNLEKLKDLKCLLFGAGTIGCNVARCLMGWGVRNITLIDNANISSSNPVRQSLFNYDDTLSGGRSKALVAAEALKRIFPGVNAVGLQLTVPMPGHPVSDKDEAEVRATVEQVDALVADHDVVFLLMDTREGRWLPTLLASSKSKIALSVALGFDSFVIVRHGVGSQDDIAPIQSGNLVPGDQLGCYFCSDVTAPGNSTRDRTLDQQCTVTRPGVSQMAAGLAVELLAAVVQHPLGGLAPAALTTVEGEGMDGEGPTGGGGCLGSTPHQIRGYVSRFSQMTPCVRRFQKCVACGTAVRRELAQRGWGFLRDAFDSPDTLETVSGLGELQVSANDIDLWEYSDNESVKSMDTVAEPS